MAGNKAIFSKSQGSKIDILILDDNGAPLSKLEGVGGEVQFDDSDSDILNHLKGLDPDVYGEIKLLNSVENISAGTVINGTQKPVAESVKEEVIEKPDNSWTKPKLKEYMDSNNIEYNSGDTKQDLLDKINK